MTSANRGKQQKVTDKDCFEDEETFRISSYDSDDSILWYNESRRVGINEGPTPQPNTPKVSTVEKAKETNVHDFWFSDEKIKALMDEWLKDDKTLCFINPCIAQILMSDYHYDMYKTWKDINIAGAQTILSISNIKGLNWVYIILYIILLC